MMKNRMLQFGSAMAFGIAFILILTSADKNYTNHGNRINGEVDSVEVFISNNKDFSSLLISRKADLDTYFVYEFSNNKVSSKTTVLLLPFKGKTRESEICNEAFMEHRDSITDDGGHTAFFKYDSNGLVTESRGGYMINDSLSCEDCTPSDVFKYSYEFDAKQNWTKKTMVKNGTVNKYTPIEYRQIYYRNEDNKQCVVK